MLNLGNLRYIIYVRKSTESDDRQQASIPAQIQELLAFAKARELIVVGEPMVEARSAMRPGRPVFAKTMKIIEEGKADGILCWNLNRLARNPKDGGDLMWALSEGIIKEI